MRAGASEAGITRRMIRGNGFEKVRQNTQLFFQAKAKGTPGLIIGASVYSGFLPATELIKISRSFEGSETISTPATERPEKEKASSPSAGPRQDRRVADGIPVIRENAEEGIFIQIALYAGRSDMADAAKKISGFGYDAKYEPYEKNENLNKLYVGPFGSRFDARRALEDIQTNIAKDAFIFQKEGE